MARVEFELLRRQIAEAARHAFNLVRTAHSEESFYSFALYTVDEALGICPSSNSEQAYARKRAKYQGRGSFNEADLLGNFRWSPYDWEFETVGADFFRFTDQLLSDQGQARYDQEAPDGFIEFKAGVFASMVLALADLDAESFFGVGDARRRVTVFC